MANNLDSLLKEIESKAHIEEIISDYVNLEKRGNNYVGLCPFHDDKSPSMSVSPSKKIFKCFSCGAKGNSFTFVQNYLGINFIEAVKKIAEKYSINWQNSITIKKDNTPKEVKEIWELNNNAKIFFKYMLSNEITDENSKVSKYLKQRKLNQEDLFSFEIGYAPKENTLIDFLKSKGYSETQIVNSGIAKLSAKGEIIPYFIDRLMFTIKDDNGNIVAFSGRTIDNNSNYVKYLNSPETKAFKKSEILFNFSNARSQISLKRFAIVVEGYMDVIAYFNKGYENVVATMGTAFSKKHLELIASSASEVVLSFDSDAAGIKATIDAGMALYAAGIKTKIFKVIGYKDVDEYFANIDDSELKNKLNDSIDFIDFLVDDYIKNNPSVPDFIKLDELVLFIKKIKSESQKQFYLSKLTNKYGIDVSELNIKKKKEKEENAISNYAADRNISVIKKEGKVEVDDLSFVQMGIEENEKVLLAYSLFSQETLNALIKSNYFFENEALKEIFLKYKSASNNGFEVNLGYDLQDLLSSIQKKVTSIKDPITKIEQLINKLKSQKLERSKIVFESKLDSTNDENEIERQTNIIWTFKKKG